MAMRAAMVKDVRAAVCAVPREQDAVDDRVAAAKAQWKQEKKEEAQESASAPAG